MGVLHPQVVHFAIGLLVAGVLFRAASLVSRDRLAFVGPTTVTLLTLGTMAALLATITGDAAHGPIEAMPGLRPIVTDHEWWGEWTRNIFLLVFVIELVAIGLRRSPWSHWTRPALIASTIVGVAGLGVLYQAGERGGRIVYGHAGGVGTRSGDPADVGHLLLAGLYQQALVERKAGRLNEANELFEEAARRFPDNVDVKLERAESLLRDRKDPGSAINALRAINPGDNRAQRIRHAILTADALVAEGQRDGAIAVLQQAIADAPNARVQQKIDEIKRMPAPQPQP